MADYGQWVNRPLANPVAARRGPTESARHRRGALRIFVRRIGERGDARWLGGFREKLLVFEFDVQGLGGFVHPLFEVDALELVRDLLLNIGQRFFHERFRAENIKSVRLAHWIADAAWLE